MDKIISSFEQKSTGQKVFIIIGIAFLLLLLISISAIITQPSRVSTTGTSVQETDKVSPTVASNSKLPQNNLSEYVGNHFQIIYPSDFYSASGNKNNGEDHIILDHKSFGINDTPYFIDILVQPSSKLSLVTVANIFESFKYSHKSMLVNGVDTIRYKGSMKIGQITTQETVNIFTKNNYTYKIQLKYDSLQEQKTIESNFEQLLNTFKAF